VSRLKDHLGRTIDDLRISITDRCNFRCVYCMPAEGLPWLPRREILSYEEILRVARLFVALGIRSIRLTGGEPLVRKDADVLVAGLDQLHPGLDLSMTTNGFFLTEKIERLAAAGLRRINVSLDSLRPEGFERMVRRDGQMVQTIRDGLRKAQRAGLHPIKVNTVVIRGENDEEVADFARLGREEGYQIRFIEYMPLGARGVWDRRHVVSSVEILERIHAAFPLLPRDPKASEPATLFRYADGGGSVGVIASVCEPFCDSCNRIRITADGQLRTCLFSQAEHDLKGLLRSGATDEELTDFIVAAVWKKERGHQINEPGFVKPSRSMSAIGG
jgi:GTP 3',8-cyclase